MQKIEHLELKTNSAQILRGDFIRTDAQTPVLVFAHGLGSTRQGEKARALAAECARRDWAFAAFDFRGHGESDGTMPELRGSHLLADLDTITQFVRARGHETIYLVGSSMGGWAAAWFAALYPQRITACALIAPAFRFLEWQRLSAGQHEQWRQTGRLRVTNQWIDLELGAGLAEEAAQYPFAQLTERFQTSCLVLHGMLDDTVPYQTSLEFIAQCQATDVQLLLLKDGDHRLSAQKEWLAQVAGDFLAARG